MVACQYCGKGHRSEEAQAACEAKASRAADRVQKTQEDRARREATALAEPPAKYILRRLLVGTPWVNIIAGLNREYPGPPSGGTKWTLVDAVALDSERLHWPEPGREYRWPPERVSIGSFIKMVQGE